jgi:hypothetical protein
VKFLRAPAPDATVWEARESPSIRATLRHGGYGRSSAPLTLMARRHPGPPSPLDYASAGYPLGLVEARPLEPVSSGIDFTTWDISQQ